MYMHMYICMYLYISLMLIIWDWITYQEAYLWKRLIYLSQQPLIAYSFLSRRNISGFHLLMFPLHFIISALSEIVVFISLWPHSKDAGNVQKRPMSLLKLFWTVPWVVFLFNDGVIHQTMTCHGGIPKLYYCWSTKAMTDCTTPVLTFPRRQTVEAVGRGENRRITTDIHPHIWICM